MSVLHTCFWPGNRICIRGWKIFSIWGEDENKFLCMWIQLATPGSCCMSVFQSGRGSLQVLTAQITACGLEMCEFTPVLQQQEASTFSCRMMKCFQIQLPVSSLNNLAEMFSYCLNCVWVSPDWNSWLSVEEMIKHWYKMVWKCASSGQTFVFL